MGKRGPAPKGEYVGQTAVLSTRLTPDLRRRLEVEVEQKPNNTISREVERRLRASFVQDDAIIDAFGSRENYALMRVISMVLELWQNPSDLTADWRQDPTAYDQVCKKVMNVLKAMRPEGEASKLSEIEQVLADASAKEHPVLVLRQVQGADTAISLTDTKQKRVLSTIKGDLGDMIDRPQFFRGTAEQMRAEADRLDQANPSPPKSKGKK